MCYRYCLSIADIVVTMEIDHPLIENKEFIPFLIEETTADIYARFQKIEQQIEIKDNILFTGESYKIAKDINGDIIKYFYENTEDPVCYAKAIYDTRNGCIQVDYLEPYIRCVSEIQNCFFHLGFEAFLLDRKKMCLHAACIDTRLGGILFSGVSGIGKSTQAELWCKHMQARQINGDRPILSKESQGWKAWGSPYAGSSKCHLNESCKIVAIVMLRQGKSCFIRRLTLTEAFRSVWSGLTIRAWDDEYVQNAISLAIELVTQIPVFEFTCTPDEQAAYFLEEALRKECES